MDIKTKDGNKKRFGGKITSNTFGSKLLLEGPLSKNQKSSFVFSVAPPTRAYGLWPRTKSN